MMKKLLVISFLIPLFYFPDLYAQNFQIFKTGANSKVSKQSIVYGLPRTGINVTIELTRTVIIKGPYAEYAQKYLGVTDVPMENSENWSISGISIASFNEPDPEQYYTLTFKTFPVNIQTLLSKENNGVLFDLSGKWKQNYTQDLNDTNKFGFEPCFIMEMQKEHVDTFYKTILNDTSFIRLPVFKKQILAKTYEELVKETAQELIKTRKRRVKLIRGEYDFHPDGETLLTMISEIQKIEDEYFSLFKGKEVKQKFSQSFTIIPDSNLTEKLLGYFNETDGWHVQQQENSQPLSVRFVKEDTKIPSTLLQSRLSDQNILYFRIPQNLFVVVSVNNTEKTKIRLPFYQFGQVQYFPMINK